MNLNINIEDLDREINGFIIGRIKHVLRNDEVIGEMIETVIKQEIGKRISRQLTDSRDLNSRIIMAIAERLPSDVQIGAMAKRLVTTDIAIALKPILALIESEESTMAKILKKEKDANG